MMMRDMKDKENECEGEKNVEIVEQWIERERV